MDNNFVQIGCWVAMAAVAFLYTKRRRTRKLSE